MKLFKTVAATAALLTATSIVTADDISEEVRDLDAFTKVALQGNMDVEVKVGPKQSVKVIADSNVIEFLRTRVRGRELEIDWDDDHDRHPNFRRIKKMQIIITMPKIEGAEVHGSGDMLVENASADRFELEVHGSGDAVFENAKMEKIYIELQGSGDIEIQGTCEDINVELQGSGDVKADRFECKTAEVEVQGSGDVDIFASASVDVTVHGSGDIRVSGKPDKISSRVRGSGDIHVR